jgi:hypothetical protein
MFQRVGKIRQRLDIVAALAEALDIEFEDLASRHAGLQPAEFGLLGKQSLRIGIEPDGQRLAVCGLGHGHESFSSYQEPPDALRANLFAGIA